MEEQNEKVEREPVEDEVAEQTEPSKKKKKKKKKKKGMGYKNSNILLLCHIETWNIAVKLHKVRYGFSVRKVISAKVQFTYNLSFLSLSIHIYNTMARVHSLV